QAAAAQAEQGVAAEQDAFAEVGNMAARVPGDKKDIETPVDLGKLYYITISDTLVSVPDPCVIRGGHGGTACPDQCIHTGSVVRVVVGEQDVLKIELPLFELVQHRLCFSRIHDQGAAMRVVHQPDIVVLQRGDGMQIHRRLE